MGTLLLDHSIDSPVKYTGTRMQDMDAIAFALERGQQHLAKLIPERLFRDAGGARAGHPSLIRLRLSVCGLG
jgi:hypothetical protein